jgi:hypothetical protein
VFPSQPSFGSPSQSANPDAQLVIEHFPALHASLAWFVLHAAPHPPQFASSVAVLVSQPSATFALQSPKPALHAMAQRPAAQEGAPFRLEQTAPHAPQLVVSSSVFVSQRPVCAQSWKAPVQAPFTWSIEFDLHAAATTPTARREPSMFQRARIHTSAGLETESQSS